ncbi:endonuclease/exonuclease/phosphatase family protein [Allorhodopirellula solitaria]|uniref:Endonuclease/Exonuclease/phosphatase family protein n=1 Tax=Allorhodopirellula solitaria TaxID=2527987 RepID=A0A5C5YIV0_9BACT|nr:endonuclease [Allorhodopirellula solitaria]TWT74793.1 Endonuclease/Exonuclease/phosphatase family protein [Allorhodopirellula solitaria]
MRTCWLLVVIAIAGWRPPVVSAAEPGFSVMCWNLEWFFDDSKQGNYSALAREKSAPTRGLWNWRRDAVAASIAEVQPSIVALQEVEGPRVLWYLARALDREHGLKYQDNAIEGEDHATEQDVGILTTRPTEVLTLMRGEVTGSMQRQETYAGVTKHLAALIEIPVAGQIETILVVNVHLRSGVAAERLRQKQAASLLRWMQVWQRSSTHVMVVGDFNTQELAGEVAGGSEMAILMGRRTADPQDDLVDLIEQVPVARRQTHLLSGKQFDRIIVSRSLIGDEPGRPDLCLRSVDVRPDLSIRGGADLLDEHWNHYWEIDAANRDLSDHYPLVAEFEIR